MVTEGIFTFIALKFSPSEDLKVCMYAVNWLSSGEKKKDNGGKKKEIGTVKYR